MTRRLVLVGAGGLAREVIEAVRAGTDYEVCGLVDDDRASRGARVFGIPVLATVDTLRRRVDADLLVCAGRGATRRDIVHRLGVPDRRYATVVHPTVEIPASCAIGPGSIVLAGVVLTASVEIGAHVVVMPHVTLTHDDVVGPFATLCAGATLAGSVTVGEAAYVGMRASVREGLSVGADATLAMGAVVIDDVPGGQTWAGLPARPLTRSGSGTGVGPRGVR